MNPTDDPLTVSGTLTFTRTGRGGRKAIVPAGPTPKVPGRIPRIARLMALAIHYEALVRAGTATHADLARHGQVTRARVTQVLNLAHLAPDIQEALLFLPRVDRGRPEIILRDLQPIAATADWKYQRRLWNELIGKPSRTAAGRPEKSAPRPPRG